MVAKGTHAMTYLATQFALLIGTLRLRIRIDLGDACAEEPLPAYAAHEAEAPAARRFRVHAR
jgi:hypothetical protein